MNSAKRRALSAYEQNSLDIAVEIASPHRLVVMLFDGAIKSIVLAKAHMESGAIPEKGAAISKAIAIIEEGLRLSLDKEKGGELAANLDALYEYMALQLLEANLHNRPELLDVVSTLLIDLKDAWNSIDKATQDQHQAQDTDYQQPLVQGSV